MYYCDKASEGQWKSGIKVSWVHLQYMGGKVKVFSTFSVGKEKLD